MEQRTGVWCLAVNLFFLIFCQDAIATIEDIIQATCGVNRGTGIVFSEDNSDYWILTAAHCVLDEKGKKEPVYLYFYHNGHRSKPVVGKIVWFKYKKGTTNDLAILKCSKKSLGKYPPPKTIPLALKNEIRTNLAVSSCGCAGSAWPTAWIGNVESIGSDRLKIVPKPKAGRSGSGVFDREGNHILGIIIWQDGTSINLDKIYELTGW